jgi:hypothetical protein
MRSTLSDLVASVGLWCDATDPDLMLGADAARSAEEVAVAIRRLSAKQAGLDSRHRSGHEAGGRLF